MMENKKCTLRGFDINNHNVPICQVEFPRAIEFENADLTKLGLLETCALVISTIVAEWKKDIAKMNVYASNIPELKYIRAEQLMKKLFQSGYLKTAYGQIVSCGTNDSASYPLTEEDTEWLVKHFMEESE